MRKTFSANATFKAMSEAKGREFDSPDSVGQIPAFVDRMQINMEEALYPVPEYRTFNEFFCRPLKEGARPIAEEGNDIWAIQPADCRLMVFPSF